MPKNNTCRDAFNIEVELQSFKNELTEKLHRLTQAFFAEINSLKSDVLKPGVLITKTPLSHSGKFINHQ